MYPEVISKPVYRALSDLTQETRLEVALPLAVKDLIRLRLKESGEQRRTFEQRYKMDFPAFKQAWKEGAIKNKYSYEVEQDYWNWEASVSDEARLKQMQENLL